jgi:hypothetical protein
MKRLVCFLLTIVSMCFLAGCGGPYVIQGKAVEGAYSTLQFVTADDEQLAEAGVPFANISVYRDATRPNERLVTTGRSDGEGMIRIPVNEFGAGWMIEQWRIEVVRAGYETTQAVLTLPPAGEDRRLLIVLGPGVSVPPRKAEDLWEEYERFK